MKRLNQEGVTLVELLIAVSILAVLAVTVMSARYYVARQTVKNSQKAFATQKAVQMIEELKTLVSGEEKLGSSTLIDYADGAKVYNPVLTTDKTVTNPADPLSQNTALGGGWRFYRHVDITGLPSDPNGAIVTVRVYLSSDGSPSGEELSNVTTVLRTIVSTFPPTQVMDVYILALANIQGWWAQVPQMKSTFDKILTSLQIENPGLQIRQHYITRTAFGRDSSYSPYINTTSYTAPTTYGPSAAMPEIYFYPGATVDQNNNPVSYFDPNQLATCGNISPDGVPQSTASQFPGCPLYSVCDMYNHAIRYPDEVTMYQAVSQAAVAAGVAPPEISERMLIEGMYSQPASYMNAVILNLHGELLPMPAMRNYSDAAKDPATYPNVRVVTHPENLRYAAGSNVNLRVYGYLDGLSDPTTLSSISTATVAQTITVLLDMPIIPASLAVTAIVGSDTLTYTKVQLASGAASMGMSWTSTLVGAPVSQTLITLYNTPLRCPGQIGNLGGLKNQNQLYSLEYIPCPIGGSFSQDLTDTSNSNNNPKNTARWIISFNVPAAQSGMHTIETRIGPTTVTAAPNLSRTYVWVGATPPITEQYQFVGDPRHCPYLDVINNNGYNWYFRTIRDGYQGTFTESAAVTGWGNDKDERDIARYYWVLRHGLLNSHAIWTTMNGFSYYYMGQGGEFGSDAQPFQYGITFVQKPWSTTGSTATTRVDEILPNNALMQAARVVASTDNKWYSKYWLGELYPDASYTTWQTYGNLATGTGAGSFYRAQHSTFAPQYASNPTCSGFQRNLAKRTFREGCTSFMNATTAGGNTFRHDSTSGLGNLQPLGSLCYPVFFFPLASPVSCTRPWTLNFPTNGPVAPVAGSPVTAMPTEWNTAPYNTASERNTIGFSAPSTLGNRLFYDSNFTTGTWPTYYGSGVLRLTDSLSNNAFFIISGLSVQANFGTYELGKSALVFMLRTFLDGGMYTGSPHITQLPLVTLQNPPQAAQLNNPTSQAVSWTSTWQRWGGNAYTEEYPAGWTESSSVTVQFNLKYSNNNGTSWFNVSDNSPTQAGQLDASHAVTVTTATWDLSNTTLFPRGNYELRVEGYRQTATEDFPLHYSYHQTNLYINR